MYKTTLKAEDIPFFAPAEPVEATEVEEVPETAPDGFQSVNEAIEQSKPVAERIDPDEIDELESSWGRVTRTGRGRDFINEWIRSLSSDPELRKKHSMKFAASILATHADEKNGSVAVSLIEWAEQTGVFKSEVAKARDELLRLRWIQATGHKSGQRVVYRLTIPTM